MAAPSGIVWGSIKGSYGRIGIYTSVSSTNTTTSVSVEVWFWSKYSVSDSNNTFYFDNLSSSGSASTSKGDVSISTTVSSGSGWSTSNQKRIGSYSYSYTRGTSAVTRYLYAKLTGVDRVGDTMYANTTVSIPKLSSYTVKYNANGGSGAPSSQTKWYGKSLTLSTTKPTRTGYSFQGWATSSSGSVAYAAGASYTSNAAATLYAVWKANTYTVKYDANGGSGAPSSQTKTYGVALTLSSTKPTRTNYNFKGWGTTASTTTVSYAAGASYTKNAGATLYAIWELAYTKPKISGFSVDRCDADGNESDEGTYALIKFNWSTFYDVSSITVSWESMLVSESVALSASDTSGSINEIVGGGTLSTDATFGITVTVSDSGGSTTKKSTLNGTKFVMDLRTGGTGVSFGKPAELDGYVDLGFKTKHRDNTEFNNAIGIFGVDTNGNVKSVFTPQSTSNNTLVGYDNYANKNGNTYLYGYDIGFYLSNTASGTTSFRPYFRRGDAYDVIFRTSGYVTNSGKDVSFILPVQKLIAGAPTIVASSNSGFVFRQGNTYTHGSSATAYAIPTSYTVGHYALYGLMITATFSDTTNVTNNDSIGIYWSGNITFE